MLSPEYRLKEGSLEIQHAWKRLVSTGAVNRGNGFVPLNASAENFLHYDFKSSEVPLVITEIRGANSAERSRRDYRFYTDPHVQNTVVIRSDSKTKPLYESLGYGSGLILITDEVIKEVLKNNPRFDGMNVIAGIHDTSKGVGLNSQGEPHSRKNWTSYFAGILGYRLQQDRQMWYKVYQGVVSKDDILRLANF